MLDAPRAELRPGWLLVGLRLAGVAVLLVQLVVWAGLHARPAQLGDLLLDVQAGRTSEVVLVEGSGRGEDSVRWRRAGTLLPYSAGAQWEWGEDTTPAEVRRLLARELPGSTVPVVRESGLAAHSRGWAGLVRLLALGLLVLGPRPWRGTRWAWLWPVLLLQEPALGALAFLLLSGPLPRVRPHEPGGDRVRGGRGLVVAVAALVALPLLWMLATWFLQHPGQGAFPVG